MLITLSFPANRSSLAQHLSYMRHTGQWGQLQTGTMDACFKSISTMVPY